MQIKYDYLIEDLCGDEHCLETNIPPQNIRDWLEAYQSQCRDNDEEPYIEGFTQFIANKKRPATIKKISRKLEMDDYRENVW